MKPKRLFVYLLIICLAAPLPSLAAIQQRSVAGHWEGAIQLPGNPLNLSIDVTAKADGSLSATITIPAQGARDMPLTNVTLSGTEFTFALPNIPGDPQFKGKLEADGAKITGTFLQGGQSFPCNLERKADPAAAAKEALTGFDEIVNDALKKFDVPGMSIAIVKGKEVILAKGYGHRDVEKQLPVTADTLFAIGSSTKAFTTFTLGTLVDEGKIEWDKPVRTYIPWLKLYDPMTTERLSVRDLVTHRSGLPRHDLVWYNNYEASRETFVRRLAYLEPSADLRTRYQYNNLMYLTAGYLTEVITGKTWEDAVRARVLQPLGMTRTNFSINDSQKDTDFAQPYAKRDDQVIKIPFRNISNIGPAGSINSSVNEMARWVMVHLNGGKYGDKKIAEAATVNEMHLPQMATGAPGERPDISSADYALGWIVDTYRGHQRVQHGGNIDGFSANVVLFPKDGLGIVVLTNLNGTPLRDLITRVIADRLFKLEKVDWLAAAAANRARAEAAAKEGEKKKEAARVAGTQPAHKLEDYMGEYEHPGYGLLKVARRDGKLEATYNNIATPLEHWHYETFNGGKGREVTFENMKYTFQTDVKGFVAKLAVTFEAAVSEIVFLKKPDARLFDAAYLARFTGEYELLGQTITISLKGNTLTAQATGQTRSELIPGVDGGFTPKLSRAVSWYFVTDESGKVTAIEMRQPSTVLTAKRK
jgi:CubicO group peptidase (beta-lactamase class C family)